MSVFESPERHPVEYLVTGDKALLIAWAIVPETVGSVTLNEVHVVLCLEDGRAMLASLAQIKFDYRYDLANERWVDVSRVLGQFSEGSSDADADPQAPDHGDPQVPG